MKSSASYRKSLPERPSHRNQRSNWGILTIFLALAILLNLLILASKLGGFNLPGNQQGYEPLQPISFSHVLHAGESQIPCLYCHRGAANSRYAGIPSADQCMNCHRFILSTLGAVREEERQAQEENREPNRIVSSEIEKIFFALGLDEALNPGGELQPIVWNRIHKLPDFVYFDHSSHSSAGIDCTECHGQVQEMERIRQVQTLSMGWCVDCHRQYQNRVTMARILKPSLDCITCHY